MVVAICIQCGSSKSEPWKACAICGFDPMEEEAALIKSVYLSVGRYESPEEQGSYSSELQRIAEAIRRGQHVEYEAEELERLKRQKELVEIYSPWRSLVRVFLPAILFLTTLFAIYLMLRYGRP